MLNESFLFESLEEHLESEFESVRGLEYWRTEIDLDLAHKQAVAIFGNLAKFRIIYEKLQRNQCLNVLIVVTFFFLTEGFRM